MRSGPAGFAARERDTLVLRVAGKPDASLTNGSVPLPACGAEVRLTLSRFPRTNAIGKVRSLEIAVTARSSVAQPPGGTRRAGQRRSRCGTSNSKAAKSMAGSARRSTTVEILSP